MNEAQVNKAIESALSKCFPTLSVTQEQVSLLKETCFVEAPKTKVQKPSGVMEHITITRDPLIDNIMRGTSVKYQNIFNVGALCMAATTIATGVTFESVHGFILTGIATYAGLKGDFTEELDQYQATVLFALWNTPNHTKTLLETDAYAIAEDYWTKNDIPSYFGNSSEKFSQALTQLDSLGVVELRDGYVTLIETINI